MKIKSRIFSVFVSVTMLLLTVFTMSACGSKKNYEVNIVIGSNSVCFVLEYSGYRSSDSAPLIDDSDPKNLKYTISENSDLLFKVCMKSLESNNYTSYYVDKSSGTILVNGTEIDIQDDGSFSLNKINENKVVNISGWCPETEVVTVKFENETEGKVSIEDFRKNLRVNNGKGYVALDEKNQFESYKSTQASVTFAFVGGNLLNFNEYPSVKTYIDSENATVGCDKDKNKDFLYSYSSFSLLDGSMYSRDLNKNGLFTVNFDLSNIDYSTFLILPIDDNFSVEGDCFYYSNSEKIFALKPTEENVDLSDMEVWVGDTKLEKVESTAEGFPQFKIPVNTTPFSLGLGDDISGYDKMYLTIKGVKLAVL